jgi:hypothetical protein
MKQMIEICGCCQGIEKVTPQSTANRPGLSELFYRVGTHGGFLETMLARLSSHDLPKLDYLRTRETDDSSIALLDAWAVVADVLTFYQERIINEGYIRTATERRSVLELARLVGYKLRPGVASSVYLAYSVDDHFKEEVIIPKGARAQSIPGPGELPQSFETSEELKARAQWNNLKLRMTKPHNIRRDKALIQKELYLEGIATNLKPNDRILLVFGPEPSKQIMRRVKEALPQPEFRRTRVSLQEIPFLVVALTSLLDNVLKTLDASRTIDDAAIYPIVEQIIANIQLDNFPPFTPDYFSRSNLYLLLSGDPEVIEGLTAFVPCPDDVLGIGILTRTAFRNAKLATTSKSLCTNGLKRLTELLKLAVTNKSLFTNVLKGLAELLKNDEAFRSDLLALMTHIAQQLNPTSLENRIELGKVKAFKNLEDILSTIEDTNEWIDDQWNTFKCNLKSNLGKDLTDALVSPVISLLREHKLHNALKELLSGLETLVIQNEHDGCLKSLEKVKELASNLKARLETIHAIPEASSKVFDLASLIESLNIPQQPQFANSLHLPRTIKLQDANSDAINQLLINFAPALTHTIYPALTNAEVKTSEPELQAVYALRLTASLFGNNAPRTPIFDRAGDLINMQEWPLAEDERPNEIFLDNEYSGVVPESYVVIRKPHGQMIARRVISVASTNRSEYNVSGKSTRVQLSERWRLSLSFNDQPQSDDDQYERWRCPLSFCHQSEPDDYQIRPDDEQPQPDFSLIRQSTIFAQSELLNMAEEPITDNICLPDPSKLDLELDGLVDGLHAGKWLIVSGERTDIAGTSGVKASELVMLAGVKQSFDEKLPGDRKHTFLTLAKPLTYCFKRDSVTIYGNVVKATHGETRKETLGSGEATKTLQSFVLKQPPLTYVSAPNSAGVDSTLKLYVNDIHWHEQDTLVELSSTDRSFIIKTDDEAKTTVIFGNGREGARLPTGSENIKAEYRSGIGKVGNVKTGQISLLATRPLGVKEVLNPLPASGGADKESRDQARKNASLAIKALDRLVSVQDYEDFARIYAGIGKARAAELSNGHRQIVHITIAGIDDIPIDKNSDLYRNLRQSLLDFGDPYQSIHLEIRELIFVVIQANIRILPDYLWEPVVTQIRIVLLDAFSFERRELGQDMMLSEVLSVMQVVPGVAYVDVDAFGGIPEKQFIAGKGRQFLTPNDIANRVELFVIEQQNLPETRIKVALADFEQEGENVIHPAQLAFFTSEVPETLILNQIT